MLCRSVFFFNCVGVSLSLFVLFSIYPCLYLLCFSLSLSLSVYARVRLRVGVFFAFACLSDQVGIAQWLAWGLATGEVPGSNPGKGESIFRQI